MKILTVLRSMKSGGAERHALQLMRGLRARGHDCLYAGPMAGWLGQQLRADGFDGELKVLTSCPACLQGLQRYNEDVEKLDADYIVIELAKNILGPDWLPTYVKQANAGGIERVLL